MQIKNVILFIILIASSAFSSTSSAQEKENKLTLKTLKEKILVEFGKIDGKCALAFHDISNPDNLILINEQEEFHAASTMKTPVMIEVFLQSSKGKFSLDDSILVRNEFKSIVDCSTFSLAIDRDSGPESYKSIGNKETIRSLVFDMITVSSNLATNLLIGLVDAKNVQETMRQLGAEKIRVLRGVEDMKAYEKGLNNTTTAFDLMLIFEKLARYEVVSREACKEMIDILKAQKLNSLIPALLPKEVKVAHKTGSVSGIKHDSGIVILPDGKQYVLVILSKDLKNDENAENRIAGISRMVYDFVASYK